jgi:hypothetical protein
MNQPATDANTANASQPAAQPSSNPAASQPAASQPVADSGAQPQGSQNPGQQPAAAGQQPAKDGKDGQAQPPAVDKIAADLGLTDLPEGMQIDKPLLEKFSGLATKHNLPPEVAKDIAAAYKENQISAFKAQAASVQAMKDGWYDECVADAEIGGPGGSNFEANASVAHKAIATFGTPKLQEILRDSGMGNHPEIVKFCLKVGRAISEDSTFAKGGSSAQPTGPKLHKDEEHAAALFGDMMKK